MQSDGFVSDSCAGAPSWSLWRQHLVIYSSQGLLLPQALDSRCRCALASDYLVRPVVSYFLLICERRVVHFDKLGHLLERFGWLLGFLDHLVPQSQLFKLLGDSVAGATAFALFFCVH